MRPFNRVDLHRPPRTASAVSWWIGLTRAQMQDALQAREAQRMRASVKGEAQQTYGIGAGLMPKRGGHNRGRA